MSSDIWKNNPFGSYWQNLMSGDVWQSFLDHYIPVTANYMNASNPTMEFMQIRDVASYEKQLDLIEEAMSAMVELMADNKLMSPLQKEMFKSFINMVEVMQGTKTLVKRSDEQEIQAMVKKLEKWKDEEPNKFQLAQEALKKALD